MHISLQSKAIIASFALSLVIGAVGCTAPSPDSSAQASHAALDEGSSNPDDDEDLASIKNGGFGGIAFVGTCVSKGDDGSSVGGDSLTVGGGRWLECSTSTNVQHSAMSVLSSKGEEGCAL